MNEKHEFVSAKIIDRERLRLHLLNAHNMDAADITVDEDDTELMLIDEVTFMADEHQIKHATTGSDN